MTNKMAAMLTLVQNQIDREENPAKENHVYQQFYLSD